MSLQQLARSLFLAYAWQNSVKVTAGAYFERKCSYFAARHQFWSNFEKRPLQAEIPNAFRPSVPYLCDGLPYTADPQTAIKRDYLCHDCPLQGHWHHNSWYRALVYNRSGSHAVEPPHMCFGCTAPQVNRLTVA